MKKLLMLSILMVTITSLFYCQSPKAEKNSNNDWERQDLTGKVRSYTEISYSAEELFGEIKKKVQSSKTVYEFNLKGNLQFVNKYKSDGSLEYKDIYKYNEKDICFEQNRYKENGAILFKQVNKNDDKGNVIESNSYNASGVLESKWFGKYDGTGKLVEYFSSTVDGSVSIKSILKFNKKGERIEYTHYVNGSLEKKRIFHYDVNGNFTGYNEYKANDSLDFKAILKRNDKDLLIEVNKYKPDGRLSETLTFEYDEKGNWIKQVKFVSEIKVPTEVIEREYEYYE